MKATPVVRRIGFSYLLILIALSSFGQQKHELKVLFVGNSYTYFWNMPLVVRTIAETQNMQIHTRQSTAGGVNLKQHWNGDFGLETKALIANSEWDIVVLQNHSMSTIDSLKDFYKYGNELISYIKDHQAEPVLYATWARKFNPLMIDQVSHAYKKLAEDNDIRLVPIGEIWQRIRQARPDLRMYHPDGSHPSTIGTYVNACTFYSFFTNKPSKGLPNRITTKDKYGDMLFLSVVSAQDAIFIQSVIDQVLEN